MTMGPEPMMRTFTLWLARWRARASRYPSLPGLGRLRHPSALPGCGNCLWAASLRVRASARRLGVGAPMREAPGAPRPHSRAPCLSSSSAPDEREEIVEDVLVVLRPGSGFGMELQSADRQHLVRQPLDAAVVEIPMAHEEACRRIDRPLVDLELV